MAEQDGPLSPEAEIVRVRGHFHELNNHVAALATATAVNGSKLDTVDKRTDEIKTLLTAQNDLLRPVVEKVSILQAVVYGAVGLTLTAVAYKLIEVAIAAAGK